MRWAMHLLDVELAKQALGHARQYRPPTRIQQSHNNTPSSNWNALMKSKKQLPHRWMLWSCSGFLLSRNSWTGDGLAGAAFLARSASALISAPGCTRTTPRTHQTTSLSKAAGGYVTAKMRTQSTPVHSQTTFPSRSTSRKEKQISCACVWLNRPGRFGPSSKVHLADRQLPQVA